MIQTLSTFFASVIHRLFEPAKFKLETDKPQYLLGETIVTDVFINPNQNLVVNDLSLSMVCFENSTEVFTRSEVPKAGPGILTKNQQDIPLDPINTQVIKETSKKLLEQKEKSHKHLQINRNQNKHELKLSGLSEQIGNIPAGDDLGRPSHYQKSDKY